MGNENNTATQAPAATGEDDECIGENHGGARGLSEPGFAFSAITHVHENCISNDQTQQQYDGETVAAVDDAATNSSVLSLEKLDAEAQQKNKEDDTN